MSKEELIYSQEDMDVVLEKLRAAEKEAEQSKQLLWAVVDHVGGEVAIPYLAWLDGVHTKELTMWDDTETYMMHLRTREVKET
jgi:DNA phosphorothioation-dependent restriction protein DptG